MRSESGLETQVLPDGKVDFFLPRTGLRHRCGPTGTLMWIILQRQDWQPERAAEVLAEQWGIASESLRPEVEAWVSHFQNEGLVRRCSA